MAALKKKDKRKPLTFEIPPKRFTARIVTHSDENGCHADCRACGWSNPRKQNKAQRDRAAWDHEKGCKAPMPVRKYKPKKKARKAPSTPQKAAQTVETVPYHGGASKPNSKPKKKTDMRSFLDEKQRAQVEKQISEVINETRKS